MFCAEESLKRIGIMFEKFSSELQKIAARIKSTFELIESFQKKSTATVDIYSKVNGKLQTDIDRLYLAIQQCYDECTDYLNENNVDINNIEAIPDNYRAAIKLKIYPFWRAFQHSINKTLQEYKNYLPQLDKDIVEELQTVVKMDTEELLNIFDSMLKSVSNEGGNIDE
jgi:hypothetical protein